jgi:hypothetical protein
MTEGRMTRFRLTLQRANNRDVHAPQIKSNKSPNRTIVKENWQLSGLVRTLTGPESQVSDIFQITVFIREILTTLRAMPRFQAANV